MRPYYGKIKEGIPWKGSEGKIPEEGSLTLMVNKETKKKIKIKLKKKKKELNNLLLPNASVLGTSAVPLS